MFCLSLCAMLRPGDKFMTSSVHSTDSRDEETKDGSSCVILFPSQRQQARALRTEHGLEATSQGTCVVGGYF